MMDVYMHNEYVEGRKDDLGHTVPCVIPGNQPPKLEFSIT